MMCGSQVSMSVVIVNWNTRDLLARCLESLRVEMSAQVVEVFVVDNASSDGSAAMVRARFPWVRLIENAENVGFARANNQALSQARGPYIVLLNSDTQVSPGALQTLVHFMETHPRAGACGPLLRNPDGSLQASCHPLLTPAREFWRLIFLDPLYRRATYPQERWGLELPRRVEVIKGACLLLRSEALDEVGLLDDRYFMYTEEMDLCYRLSRAGWELWWVPQATIMHHGEASSRQVSEQMYVQLYRSKVQFHRKFGGEGRASRFRFLLFLAYVPRWVVAAVSVPWFRDLAGRERTYRRLLSELAKM